MLFRPAELTHTTDKFEFTTKEFGARQWRRHHRGRGGRLPPQPQAWGGIATPEMWDGTESEIDAAKTRNSLAAARTGDLL